MENNLTLQLGGEERTLVMGKNGFLKNLSKVNTNEIDLLDTSYFRNPGKSYEVALIIVKAGLMTAGFDIDPATIEKWFDDLPLETLNDIHFAGIAGITQTSVEELKNAAAQAVTQNGATKIPG